MMNARRDATIVSLFWERVAQSGSRPALWNKYDGSFRSRTWNELAADVIRFAHVLRDCGVARQEPVVQIAENRYEWLVLDLAIQSLGAIHVPVHPTLSGVQMAEQIQDCGARVVCLAANETAAKLDGAAAHLPQNPIWLGCGVSTRAISGQPVRSLLDEASTAPVDEIPERHAARPDEIATILYTSGTTGHPKGVMLSQDNLASNTLGVLTAMKHRPDDMRLGFLPLSHIFARTCDVYSWIAVGCEFAQAENRSTVLDDCQAVRPTVLNAVPFFFERVVKVLTDRGAEDPAALRELLGGRIEWCCSGGAALPVHLYDYFVERGVPILQGYGLTESSPVITVSTGEANRRGAVGQAIPGVEVKIAADGEILTRGPHVMMGYYKQPKATAEVVRDGWLYTGDVGRLDEDGFLYITGRKKEILVTSAGKNIPPTFIEALLSEDPLIHQVMIVGDNRPCLGALIVPDPDCLRAAIIEQRIPVTNREEALAHPRVRALYAEVLKARLANVAHYEQVPVFHLVPRAFSLEESEVTPKLTFRRDTIAAHFAAEIDAMYAEGASRRGAACTPIPETKVTS